MSTRSLTCYKKEGEFKIAKYTQCDGYPSGLGSELCKKLKKIGLETVESNLWKAQFLTKDEIDEINSDRDWQINYPYLSSDVNGADILDYLLEADTEIKLVNSEQFAADSLFCEWAYVVDFDTGTLQIYKGFNKTPLTPVDMFYYLQKDNKEYMPVKLVTVFTFDQLPDALQTNCDEDEKYFITPVYNEQTKENLEIIVEKKDGLWFTTYGDDNPIFWNKNKYRALEALTKHLVENL